MAASQRVRDSRAVALAFAARPLLLFDRRTSDVSGDHVVAALFLVVVLCWWWPRAHFWAARVTGRAARSAAAGARAPRRPLRAKRAGESASALSLGRRRALTPKVGLLGTRLPGLYARSWRRSFGSRHVAAPRRLRVEFCGFSQEVSTRHPADRATSGSVPCGDRCSTTRLPSAAALLPPDVPPPGRRSPAHAGDLRHGLLRLRLPPHPQLCLRRHPAGIGNA